MEYELGVYADDWAPNGTMPAAGTMLTNNLE